MSAFYDEMAATASSLLGEYGQPATFTRTPKIVDGVSGTVTDGDPTTSTANAVVLPASKGTVEAFDNRLEELSLAGKQLRYLKVAALGMDFEPASLDTCVFDGATWQVLGCTPLNPAGTALLYGMGVVKL